jgi:hypothetical protein
MASSVPAEGFVNLDLTRIDVKSEESEEAGGCVAHCASSMLHWIAAGVLAVVAIIVVVVLVAIAAALLPAADKSPYTTEEMRVLAPQMAAVINANMQDPATGQLLEGGKHLGNLAEIKSHLPQKPYQICASVDFTNAESDQASLNKVLDAIGIRALCDEASGTQKTDPTCRALNGALQATKALAANFTRGPAFQKYLMVSWGASKNSTNPVSTCRKGSVGAITIPSDGSPPTASLKDGNGCNMYGLCNIFVTTLLQANDQVSTGTCGMQAMYASMAKVNPAKAIRTALQLLWTGQVLDLPVCGYIWNQNPGLVPYSSNQFGCVGDKCEKPACAGNAVPPTPIPLC